MFDPEIFSQAFWISLCPTHKQVSPDLSCEECMCGLWIYYSEENEDFDLVGPDYFSGLSKSNSHYWTGLLYKMMLATYSQETVTWHQAQLVSITVSAPEKDSCTNYEL